MNEEPKSICEKHCLEVCEDCVKNGRWTFPKEAPDDDFIDAEYKIMSAIGNLDGEQMKNENGELFIKYTDVQNALSQIIIPTISSLLHSKEKELREKCRRIFIEKVDWAEWGMSEEDAGELFDKEINK